MWLHYFTSSLSSAVTSCQRYGNTILASDWLQGKRVSLRAAELLVRQFVLHLAFAYFKCFSHFLLVGQRQTSQVDVKMWTQARVVKCAAPIPCCGPNCSEQLHTLSSPICNSSLDSAYFPPEGGEGEQLNLHSSWRQKFSEKIRALTWWFYMHLDVLSAHGHSTEIAFPWMGR